MSSILPFRKTRIAPTPSGYLHAGNALNFLLTAALAEKAGAGLLLRIDDMDQQRYRPAYAEDVFDTLQFLNIQWTEGPQNLIEFENEWSQQQRMPLYTEALEQLKKAGALFACTCSRTQQGECRCAEKNISLEALNTNWRLLTNDEPVIVKQADGTTLEASLPAELKNFVVRKKDGFPAYQLCSVVDDLHFCVDFIVRGRDLWPSTLAQLYLAKQLGEHQFADVRFCHHSLLKGVDGEKLSKSAGAVSVRHWREEGKGREEFLAYLGALLGITSKVSSGADVMKFLGV